MLRKILVTIAAIAAFAATGAAQGQFGTSAEAKAMLEKAVAAVKADKAKALADFQAGAVASRTATCTCSAPGRTA